jgi:predicted anti-sigma-YlaC factor YlaD
MWFISQWFVYLQTVSDIANPTSGIETYESVSLVCLGLYDSAFSLAIWLFAYHYFRSATHIEMLLLKQNPQTKQERLKIFFWIISCLNLVLPILAECWQFFFPKPLDPKQVDIKQNRWRAVSVGFTLALQLGSAVVLSIAIWKISRVVDSSTSKKIQVKRVV